MNFDPSRRNFLKLLGVFGAVASVKPAELVRMIEAPVIPPEVLVPPPVEVARRLAQPAKSAIRLILGEQTFYANELTMEQPLNDFDRGVDSFGYEYFVPLLPRRHAEIRALLLLDDESPSHPFLDLRTNKMPFEVNVSDMGKWHAMRFTGECYLTGFNSRVGLSEEYLGEVDLRLTGPVEIHR